MLQLREKINENQKIPGSLPRLGMLKKQKKLQLQVKGKTNWKELEPDSNPRRVGAATTAQTARFPLSLLAKDLFVQRGNVRVTNGTSWRKIPASRSNNYQGRSRLNPIAAEGGNERGKMRGGRRGK